MSRPRNSRRKTKEYSGPHRNKEFEEFQQFQEFKRGAGRPPQKKQKREREYSRFEDIDFGPDDDGDSWVVERDRELEDKSPKFSPRTENQRLYVEAVEDNDLVFVKGVAGSGKSSCAAGIALDHLKRGLVTKIVISRPIVEVGQKMGYLPGNGDEKINPYLAPLYDEFIKHTTEEEWKSLVKNKIVQAQPIAFIRGKTFEDTFFILDEAQNCLKGELKVILTRMGDNSKYIVNGDIEQSDLPKNEQGWFNTYAERFSALDGVALVQLNKLDIQRHYLVSGMLEVGFD
jgi:phosphate starvation-inducible protein PhoH and related proteins